MAELVQRMALNMNGGSIKMNWNRLNTSITADRKGYRNTNCPVKSSRKSFSRISICLSDRKKNVAAMIKTKTRIILKRLFSM